jgi:hypothetical protein
LLTSFWFGEKNNRPHSSSRRPVNLPVLQTLSIDFEKDPIGSELRSVATMPVNMTTSSADTMPAAI